MTTINSNYLKLPSSYLFSEIARRVSTYSAEHSECRLIRLGTGRSRAPRHGLSVD